MCTRNITLLTLILCTCLSTSVDAQTDIFDGDVIEIGITVPDPAWHDTLFDRKSRGDKTPIIGTVTIAGKEYRDVELRYKGNSSFHGAALYGVTKMPLKLETPKGEFFDGGYDELRLSTTIVTLLLSVSFCHF